ncbi:MAG: hypothetical protein DMG65_25975 [Candidatus Angelobacter sp. Gp1-AA117]|nr:MAG: hypothetical protein DMG65_25975 [Candidatus Angelobacter sp. Gp1-AA117]
MRKGLAFAAAIVCMAMLAGAQQNRGPSTPEERERFVAIAHKMEADPLNANLKADREWAFRWLVEVPDIHVNVCMAPLGKFIDEKTYKYSPQIVLQLTLSSGAFVIEHPDKADDKDAQYFAGVEGALKAYQAILKGAPNAKSTSLDTLLEKQASGQLADFVREQAKTGCQG